MENNWTADVNDILDKIRINSIVLSNEHKSTYFKLSSRIKWFRVPVILLSALGSMFGMGLNPFLPQLVITELCSIMSLVVGLIGSLELFLAISNKMENELVQSKELYLLAIEIQKTLLLDTQNRNGDGMAYLEDKFNMYSKLIENSYLLECKILDELTPLPTKFQENIQLLSPSHSSNDQTKKTDKKRSSTQSPRKTKVAILNMKNIKNEDGDIKTKNAFRDLSNRIFIPYSKVFPEKRASKHNKLLEINRQKEDRPREDYSSTHGEPERNELSSHSSLKDILNNEVLNTSSNSNDIRMLEKMYPGSSVIRIPKQSKPETHHKPDDISHHFNHIRTKITTDHPKNTSSSAMLPRLNKTKHTEIRPATPHPTSDLGDSPNVLTEYSTRRKPTNEYDLEDMENGEIIHFSAANDSNRHHTNDDDRDDNSNRHMSGLLKPEETYVIIQPSNRDNENNGSSKADSNEFQNQIIASNHRHHHNHANHDIMSSRASFSHHDHKPTTASFHKFKSFVDVYKDGPPHIPAFQKQHDKSISVMVTHAAQRYNDSVNDHNIRHKK
jgi:hypothetical protein